MVVFIYGRLPIPCLSFEQLRDGRHCELTNAVIQVSYNSFGHIYTLCALYMMI